MTIDEYTPTIVTVAEPRLRSLTPGYQIPRSINACARELTEMRCLPCFVYDLHTVRRQCESTLRIIGAGGGAYFAAKAHSHARILSEVVQAGMGVDVSSARELRQALASGCTPDHIIMTGPGKTYDDLAAAVKARIALIALESLREARELSMMLAGVKRRQNVLLRIVPARCIEGPNDNAPGFYCLAGAATKYGFDEETIDTTIRTLRDYGHLDIVGLHLFFASGVMSERFYYTGVETALELLNAVQQLVPEKLQILDLGGGWGVNFTSGAVLEISSLVEHVQSLARYRGLVSPSHLLVELGAFIMGPAGFYCAQIIDVKQSRGKIFAIVNGGIYHLLRPAIVGPHRIIVCEAVNRDGICAPPPSNCMRVEVVGNSCHPFDVLARDVCVLEDKADGLLGKMIVLTNCGAYGETFAARGFQGRMPARHVWTNSGPVL